MGEKTDKLGFAEPMGIAANEKRLYVVDRYNSVVKVYSLKHKIFRHMMGYNRFEPQKSLRYPKDIALFNDVTVVSDFGNDRLMFFSIDKTTPGKFLRTLGARPENPLKLHAPYGVEFDQLGNLYVADLGNNRVLKFDCPAWENGTISVVITSTDDGRPLESPQCVKVNSRGEVAVLDVDRREVIIFQADWYHKGRMLYEAGEFEKAIPCFEKANTNALRAKRVNVYSLFYYAVSLEHLDRLEEAWQVYDQLVKKFTYGPIFKRARYRMKHLEPLLLR
jgi:tetratricopeptide (TPR) repeat protein